jgi:hypothetical protein
VKRDLFCVVKLRPELDAATRHRNLRGHGKVANRSAVVVCLVRPWRRTGPARGYTSGGIKTTVTLSRGALITLNASVAEVSGDLLLRILVNYDLRDVWWSFTRGSLQGRLVHQRWSY